MLTFNWDGFKEFREHSHQTDKLKIAIDFMKSYYNISSPQDMYDMLKRDELGEMLLNKRNISSSHGFEDFMYS